MNVVEEKLKVCITVGFPFPGVTGSPLHVMTIAKKLKNMGIYAFVVEFKGLSLKKVEKDEWEGIEIYRVPFPWRTLYFLHLLIKIKPDVIHAQHISGTIYSFIPSKLLRIPLIYEVHSFWAAEADMAGDSRRLYVLIYKMIENLVFKQAESVIAISEKMKEALSKENNVLPEKLELIYPGVDFDDFDERKTKNIEIRNVNKKDLIVMYAGNFWPWQGVDLLLESVPYVLKRVNNVKFILIGGKKKEIKNKKKKVKGYSDNVIFLERVPHGLMLSYLRIADVLVIPRPNVKVNWVVSRKFVEYMASGKPIVATDVGDHKSLLSNNNCGIVTECNPKSFAEGLVRILTANDEERKKMGYNAKKTAKEIFNISKLIHQYIQIYRRVLSKSKRRM